MVGATADESVRLSGTVQNIICTDVYDTVRADVRSSVEFREKLEKLNFRECGHEHRAHRAQRQSATSARATANLCPVTAVENWCTINLSSENHQSR